MAALPSVVLGFLAGPVAGAAWSSGSCPGLFLLPLVLPVAILGALLALAAAAARDPRPASARAPRSSCSFPVVAARAPGLALRAGRRRRGARCSAATTAAGCSTALGLTYDQRNSLVVGVAMGFAVIPIIFTIAEDSLANVPQHLRAGSLALGATRWQTALRIVLPTASPGIFSAIMIGFGRAVGETMIVLMATGNTPVMDWSIFNGFRALSANIAVELPEAPEGGTLFRVLFLAALLLFCLTFVGQHRGRAGAPPAAPEVPLPVKRRLAVRSGEPFIWLTGGALALALLMVAGLDRPHPGRTALGFFWPATVDAAHAAGRQDRSPARWSSASRSRASPASTGSS